MGDQDLVVVFEGDDLDDQFVFMKGQCKWLFVVVQDDVVDEGWIVDQVGDLYVFVVVQFEVQV